MEQIALCCNVSLLLLFRLHFALKRTRVLQASLQFPFCLCFSQRSSLPIPKTLIPLVDTFLCFLLAWFTTVDYSVAHMQTHTIPDGILALASTSRMPQTQRIDRDACRAN